MKCSSPVDASATAPSVLFFRSTLNRMVTDDMILDVRFELHEDRSRCSNGSCSGEQRFVLLAQGIVTTDPHSSRVEMTRCKQQQQQQTPLTLG
jgi:hypothetical protein